MDQSKQNSTKVTTTVKFMNKKSSSNIIIIGAGLGGIAAAARLAKAGWQVTVLEKNSTAGGRCNQLIKDGHRFDIGPTLYLMPEIFAETYNALGKKVQDRLDLRRIDPTYRIRWNDGSELGLTANLIDLQAQLEAIEPGSFGGLLNYLAEGSRHYHVSLEKFIGRNFLNIFEYLNIRNLPLIFSAKALVKHYPNASRYFSNPRLRAAFTFQDMYLGVSPFDALATYSLLQYTELADGVWYPIGGMYRIIQDLVEIAEELGVKFIYEAPVEKIEVNGDRATSVRLANGEQLFADVILANADLPYVYRKLLPDQKQSRKLQKLKYTCSTIMFFWGVDQTYPELGHHNVFLSDDYYESFNQIFNQHSLPQNPSFYVHAPSRIDPASAPPAQDTIFVLVPVGHLVDGETQDWESMVNRSREAVLNRLAKMGMPDLKNHIKFEITMEPRDWEQWYNLEKGSTFGLSHNFMQVGYFRPQNRHRKWKNLYFVGSSTHPGGGLPIALLSARLVTERIIKGI